MNKSAFVVFLLVSLLVSCDPAYKMLIDGKPQYLLENDCGSVLITSYSALSDMINVHFEGNYEVHLDSLKLMHYGSSDFTVGFAIVEKEKFIEIKDIHQPIIVNGEEELNIWVTNVEPIHYGHRKGQHIVFYPSAFIVCNGQPLFTDTLHFEVEGGPIMPWHHD
jgi:hypothetical protein